MLFGALVLFGAFVLFGALVAFCLFKNLSSVSSTSSNLRPLVLFGALGAVVAPGALVIFGALGAVVAPGALVLLGALGAVVAPGALVLLGALGPFKNLGPTRMSFRSA